MTVWFSLRASIGGRQIEADDLLSVGMEFQCTYNLSPDFLWVSDLFGIVALLTTSLCELCCNLEHSPAYAAHKNRQIIREILGYSDALSLVIKPFLVGQILQSLSSMFPGSRRNL
jgi:hypothetical protein